MCEYGLILHACLVIIEHEVCKHHEGSKHSIIVSLAQVGSQRGPINVVGGVNWTSPLIS